MKAILRKILIFLILAGTAPCGFTASSAPVWEEVTAPIPQIAQTVDSDPDTEIAVHEGYIYIRSDKPVTVKLFSILGQQISQETVKAGTHRIRIHSRGIYILRVGTTTRRITI